MEVAKLKKSKYQKPMIKIFKFFIICLFCSSWGHTQENEWKKPLRGSNVFSELPLSDLKEARASGIKVIRIGAVGLHEDLKYLVKEDDWDFSKKNMDRFEGSIKRAREANLKVILTLSEVPGRKWEFGKHDFRLFENFEFHKKFIDGWKTIAQVLGKYDNVIGYDILNEPLLPEELNGSSIDYKSFKKRIKETPKDINKLYQQTIAAIRTVDSKTPILIQPTRWGSRDALNILDKQSDNNIIYSIHYYDPFPYFAKRKNKGKLKYPGSIPEWVTEKGIGPFREWNKDVHLKNLTKIKAWAQAHSIENSKIFIGEFGVWREARGAALYLEDVLNIFNKMGWSWAYYSYREHGWNNTNLEMEDEFGKKEALFKLIMPHFQ